MITLKDDKLLIGLLIFCGLFYMVSFISTGLIPGIYLVLLSKATLEVIGFIDDVSGNPWYEMGEGVWGVSFTLSMFWPIALVLIYVFINTKLTKLNKGWRFSIFILLVYIATVLLTLASVYDNR